MVGSQAFPNILPGGSGSKKILKVGLVGCGGRGTGAASNILAADPNVVLWSIGDVFQKKIDNSVRRLSKLDRVKLPKERQFVGFDAYQKVIDSGVDIVLLTTTPAFRPLHLKAAIDGGKHVFAEKPLAVDVPGVKSVLESAKKARANGLSILTGFVWRYTERTQQLYLKIHNGDIGDVVSVYSHYFAGRVHPLPDPKYRPLGMSDIEWKLPYWQNFVELSGDSIVEQSIHSVDKISWAFNDKPPLSCTANGGRQVALPGTNIFDHFSVNYEYEGGARAFLSSRQIGRCHNGTEDHITGTAGSAKVGGVASITKEKENVWTSTKGGLGYVDEHKLFVDHIRRGEVYCDVDVSAATSTYLAIMGRMAAYTGKYVTWKDLMNSKESFIDVGSMDYDKPFAHRDIAQPGVTKFI